MGKKALRGISVTIGCYRAPERRGGEEGDGAKRVEAVEHFRRGYGAESQEKP